MPQGGISSGSALFAKTKSTVRERNVILFGNHNNSNSMFLFLAILIGPLVKLNGFYTSIKTCAYEYLISALISQC